MLPNIPYHLFPLLLSSSFPSPPQVVVEERKPKSPPLAAQVNPENAEIFEKVKVGKMGETRNEEAMCMWLEVGFDDSVVVAVVLLSVLVFAKCDDRYPVGYFPFPQCHLRPLGNECLTSKMLIECPCVL